MDASGGGVGATLPHLMRNDTTILSAILVTTYVGGDELHNNKTKIIRSYFRVEEILSQPT